MKVYIVEASYPKDFYSEALDGMAARHILNTMEVTNKFRMTLDKRHFKKAIKEVVVDKWKILHLSCHGDAAGIGLPNYDELTWKQFAELFPQDSPAPALVMSTCKGAVGGISKAFASRKNPPPFIFGSKDVRDYEDYVTAWSILYRRLLHDGLSKTAVQQALKEISAVVHESFIYRRWDKESEEYLRYPGDGRTFAVRECGNSTK